MQKLWTQAQAAETSKSIVSLWVEDDAAAYLNQKTTTLQQWRWQGRGPPYLKIGRNVRYEPESVRAWARAQQRHSTNDTGDTTDENLAKRYESARAAPTKQSAPAS